MLLGLILFPLCYLRPVTNVIEDLSEYKVNMNKQEHRYSRNTPSTLTTSSESTPITKELKKNLSTTFSKDVDPLKRSYFCSLLNQHLLEELNVNPNTFGPELIATIQAMAEEGNLPDDETMDEVLIERDTILLAEHEYTSLTPASTNRTLGDTNYEID